MKEERCLHSKFQNDNQSVLLDAEVFILFSEIEIKKSLCMLTFKF